MPFRVCQQIYLLNGHSEQQLSSPSYENLVAIVTDSGILLAHSLREPVAGNLIRPPPWSDCDHVASSFLLHPPPQT